MCFNIWDEDPHHLCRKEIRSITDPEFGTRVLSYDQDTQEYLIKSIRWSDGEMRQSHIQSWWKNSLNKCFDFASARPITFKR